MPLLKEDVNVLVNLLLQHSVEIPTCIMERMHLDDPLERSVSTGGWLLAIYSSWCFVTAIHRNERENDKTVVNVIALLSGAGCTIVTVVIAFMMMSSLIR